MLQQTQFIKQVILDLFEDDLVAQTIVEGDMDGIEGEELRSLTGLDLKAFASKRRLIRRRINGKFPKGMGFMSDPRRNPKEALDRLTEKLVEDVLNAPDGELLEEAKEEGRDVAGGSP